MLFIWELFDGAFALRASILHGCALRLPIASAREWWGAVRRRWIWHRDALSLASPVNMRARDDFECQIACILRKNEENPHFL